MSEPKKGLIRRCVGFLLRPSKRSLLTLLVVGGVVGLVGMWSVVTAMHMSSTETFCLSCHEMRDNVYAEYKDSVHDKNRTGVRATCPDCHVPRAWIPLVQRKIGATLKELPHHYTGMLDTKEKFESNRMEMATWVWNAMKENDSRECRNCHSWEGMDAAKQRPRAQKNHKEAQEQGKTCIDCHKGIAHLLPKEYAEDEE
jgi:cytochrome c-type protein NapC